MCQHLCGSMPVGICREGHGSVSNNQVLVCREACNFRSTVVTGFEIVLMGMQFQQQLVGPFLKVAK